MNEELKSDLVGKVAIVTGSGDGIGKATAIALARSGCSVAVVDINPSKSQETVNMITDFGANAFFSKTNISMPEEVNSMTNMVLEKYGRIDILVNNAGICLNNKFTDISVSEWDSVINVNLKGAFLCCQAVLPYFLEAGCGNIVNISSLAGRRSSVMGGAHYSASKAGLLGLTRHLANEVASYGIRVNAICPGAVRTAIQYGNLSNDLIIKKASKIPLKRIGEPEDIAHAVVFLVSDGASFITGATLDVNGGALMM